MHRALFSLAFLLMMLAPMACEPPDTEAPEGAPPVLPSSAPDGTTTEGLGSVPTFALPTLDGDTLRFDELDAEVFIINFWATWCGPCIEEIPELTDLYTELNPHGLEIIGISLDEEGAEVVAPFASELEINYPVVLDDGTAAEAFGGVWALPTTYVVDSDGQIEQRVIGLFPVEANRPALRQRLGVGPAN